MGEGRPGGGRGVLASRRGAVRPGGESQGPAVVLGPAVMWTVVARLHTLPLGGPGPPSARLESSQPHELRAPLWPREADLGPPGPKAWLQLQLMPDGPAATSLSETWASHLHSP